MHSYTRLLETPGHRDGIKYNSELPRLLISAAALSLFPVNLCLCSPPPRSVVRGGTGAVKGRLCGKPRKTGWPKKGEKRKNQTESAALSGHANKSRAVGDAPHQSLSSHRRSLALPPSCFCPISLGSRRAKTERRIYSWLARRCWQGVSPRVRNGCESGKGGTLILSIPGSGHTCNKENPPGPGPLSVPEALTSQMETVVRQSHKGSHLGNWVSVRPLSCGGGGRLLWGTRPPPE